MWWSSSSGRIELEMTAKQAASVSHPGQCEDDVLALMEQPEIKQQFDTIPNSLMVFELAEYGAWDAEQLQDNHRNRVRLVWIAGCDLRENGE